MKVNKHLRIFLQNFFHPQVYIFIFIGAAVIFLTFLTNNNALEIAISGIASVFIGIGVNNLSSLETRIKDEQKLKRKIRHTVKIMELLESRVNQNIIHARNGQYEIVKTEPEELQKFIQVSIELVKDDDSFI
jgi:hypothetical protein